MQTEIKESIEPYCMRGHRVLRQGPEVIGDVAASVCRVLGIRKSSFRAGRVEHLVLDLEGYGIHVDPVDDDEWLEVTRAMADPSRFMIYMPQSLYGELIRGRADAVRIFLHELGHIILGHKQLMHYSNSWDMPTQYDDSEWQADYFADSIIDRVGLKRADMQFEFKF